METNYKIIQIQHLTRQEDISAEKWYTIKYMNIYILCVHIYNNFTWMILKCLIYICIYNFRLENKFKKYII